MSGWKDKVVSMGEAVERVRSVDTLGIPLGPGQVRVGDLVPGLPSLGFGDHDPAVAQATEAVRDIRAGQVQISGELPGMCGARQQ